MSTEDQRLTKGTSRNWVKWVVVPLVLAAIAFRLWARRRQARTGAQVPVFWTTLALVMLLPLGVFALSGWDLVGALPLPLEQVAHLAGGDLDIRGLSLRAAERLVNTKEGSVARQLREKKHA